MDRIIIKGGRPLQGAVTVSGSKNAALALMAASLLAAGEHRIAGLPLLRDITTMSRLLSHLGAQQEWSDSGALIIDTARISSQEAPYDLVKTMRASFLVLGPLVARFGRAKVSLPGGCAIGLRPVDLHIKALEAMGVKITIDQGYVHAVCSKLRGAHILFDVPTVGGTENVMMAACLAEGTTMIDNAAREPEVVELACTLTEMGARISGAGTDTIVIEGAAQLRPLACRVMPDRIEAGTLMIAAGMAGGEITVRNCPAAVMKATMDKLREIGMRIEEHGDEVRVLKAGSLHPVEITTNPYPGFPTDMQAQFMALLTLAKGTSIINETVFENRFIHVAELERMGAAIRVEHDIAVINGVERLQGAAVMATDLRASASLVLAGLGAQGTTVVSRVYHLDRGYERLEEKLHALGADVRREAV